GAVGEDAGRVRRRGALGQRRLAPGDLVPVPVLLARRLTAVGLGPLGHRLLGEAHPVVLRQRVAGLLEGAQRRRQPADDLRQRPADGAAQKAEALVVGVALGAARLAAVARLAEADGAGGGDGGALPVALVAHRQAAAGARGPCGGRGGGPPPRLPGAGAGRS